MILIPPFNEPTRLLPGCRTEGGVEGELEALQELILDVNCGRDIVISVPLFGEGDAVLLEFVLGLEVARNLPAVTVVGSRRVELHSIVRLGLDF